MIASQALRYVSPRVRSTVTPEFLAATRVIVPRISQWIEERGIPHRKVSNWLEIDGAKPRPGFWQPKLYLCVGPSYWKVAARVVADEELRAMVAGLKILLPWIHGKIPSRSELVRLMVRPDKIVVYLQDVHAIAPAIARLAVLRRSARTHSISHACSPSDFAMCDVATGRGIFLGLDPVFLSVSWRVYRLLALAWLKLNRAVIRREFGSVDAWLSAMNISSSHCGPQELSQTRRQVEFIKQQWKRISPIK